jgi:ATP-dependent Lon protease
VAPFVVGRESSVRTLEEALAADKKIFLATQQDAGVDEPRPNEIYQVGTVVNIVQCLKLPDGNIKVRVEGIERGKILQISETEGFLQATIRLPRYGTETNSQIESDMQWVTSLFEQYVKLCQSLNYETMIADVRMEDPAKLTDTIAANLQLSIEQKQGLLEIFDPAKRLSRMGDVLDIEIEKLQTAMIEGRTRQSHSPYKYQREWLEIMMKSVELHRAKLPDLQIPRDGQVSILMVHDPRGGYCTLPGDEVVLRELAQWIRSDRPD